MENVNENVETTVPTRATTDVPETAEAPLTQADPADPEPPSETETAGEPAPAPHAAYMSMLGNESPLPSRPAFLSYIRPGFWDDVH